MADGSNKIQPSQTPVADLLCGSPLFSDATEKQCRIEVAKKEAAPKDSFVTFPVPYRTAQDAPKAASPEANAPAGKSREASEAPAGAYKSARRIPDWMRLHFETPQERLRRISQILQEAARQILPALARVPVSFPPFPPRQDPPDGGEGGAGGEGGSADGGAAGSPDDGGAGGVEEYPEVGGSAGYDGEGGAGGAGGDEGVAGAGGAGGDEGAAGAGGDEGIAGAGGQGGEPVEEPGQGGAGGDPGAGGEGGEGGVGGAGGEPVEDPVNCAIDEDGDGYFSPLPLEQHPEQCADAPELVPELQDCDDMDPERYPGRPEGLGAGEDANCDGNNEPRVGVDTIEIRGNPGENLGLNFTAVGGKQAIAVGDFIADGIPDIAVATRDYYDPNREADGYLGKVLIYSGAHMAARLNSENADVTLVGSVNGSLGAYLDASPVQMRLANGRQITAHTLHIGDSSLNTAGAIHHFLPREQWPQRVDFRNTNIQQFARGGGIHGVPGQGIGLPFNMKDIGDFTGDGRSDVLIPASNSVIVADREAALANRYQSIEDLPGVRIINLDEQATEEIESGDFNGDGFTDLVLIKPIEGPSVRGLATKIYGGRTINGNSLPSEIDINTIGPHSEIRHVNYLGRNPGDMIGLAHTTGKFFGPNQDHLALGGHNVDNGNEDSGGTFLINSREEVELDLQNGSTIIVGDENTGFRGHEINGDIPDARMPWSALAASKGRGGTDSLVIGGSNYGLNTSNGLVVTIDPSTIQNIDGHMTIADAAQRIPGTPNLLLGASALQIGDLNGDGYPEVAVWGDGARDDPPGVTHIFFSKD